MSGARNRQNTVFLTKRCNRQLYALSKNTNLLDSVDVEPIKPFCTSYSIQALGRQRVVAIARTCSTEK